MREAHRSAFFYFKYVVFVVIYIFKSANILQFYFLFYLL